MVLGCVVQFDVANAAFALLNIARYTFTAFAAEPDRPIHGESFADFLCPRWANLCQISGEDVARSASLRTVDHDDWLVR